MSCDLTPALRTPGGIASGPGTGEFPHQQGVRQALAEYLKAIDPTQARIRFQPPPFAARDVRPSIISTMDRRPTPSEVPAAHSPQVEPGFSSRMPSASEGPSGTAASADRFGREESAAAALPHAPGEEFGSNVIQVHNTYLVAQTDEGIIIVDQHALHERILYEKFREQLLAGPLESQRLLIPETLEVSPPQARAAEQHRELLGRLGIELSTFGPTALAVQAFPALLPDVDIHGFVGDLLDKIAETEESQSEEAHLHGALDMMACKAAVKAGDPLSTEEMQALLAQRHLVQRSSNCPHGRPTTLQLSTRDLEKQFKRV